LLNYAWGLFRRAKGGSLGPHAQPVVTTVLLLQVD
jgi:hypothetical protein